jgi:curli production assembly/transport component CsgF
MLRRMVLLTSLLALGVGLGSAERGHASELVHEFVNPAFGGNPLNGPFLLNTATLQNSFTEEDGGLVRPPDNLLGDFEERLNRSILSRLSRQLVEDIFGEEGGGITTGTFTIGDLTLEVTEDLDGVSIGITDILTGDATTIQIPFF